MDTANPSQHCISHMKNTNDDGVGLHLGPRLRYDRQRWRLCCPCGAVSDWPYPRWDAVHTAPCIVPHGAL